MRALAFALALLGAAPPAAASDIAVRGVLVVDALAKSERTLAQLDPLGAVLVREGRFEARRDGDVAPGTDPKRWRAAVLDADGRLDDKASPRVAGRR